MYSSNKIAPLEIETLQTISSEKGNQNVPPPFSKTEHSSVRQIYDATDNEPDSIHYTSWLFGILLTCIAMIPILIVPWHNALREPFYWYEYHVYFAAPSWLPLVVANYIMRLEYWAGIIIYDKKMNLFFFLIGTGGVFYAVITLFHYFVHVYYFELFAPLPYGSQIPGALCGLVFLIPMLFFRYHNTSTYRVQKWNLPPLLKWHI